MVLLKELPAFYENWLFTALFYSGLSLDRILNRLNPVCV